MIFGLLAGAAALAECHERDSLQGHRVRANSWKSFRFRIWKLECANSSVSNSMNKLRHLESSSPPRCWDIFVHGGSLWWKWAISETWPGWDCQWVANLPTRPIWPTWPIQPILAYFSLFSLFLLEERTFLVTATVLGCTQVTGCVLWEGNHPDLRGLPRMY